jgi:Flp pilus assembly protein TadD
VAGEPPTPAAEAAAAPLDRLRGHLALVTRQDLVQTSCRPPGLLMGKRSRSKREQRLDGREAVSVGAVLSRAVPAGPPSIAIIAGLTAIVAAVFGQLATHTFLIYDDADYVSRNPQVKSGLTAQGFRWAFTTFHASNWHPVTWLSHMLDVQLFGMRPGMHLLVNMALHAVATAVLFLLLSAATGALWRSAMVAALFAVHPLHVESVAWLSERKDVLSTALLMLTFLFYVRWSGTRKPLWYGLMIGSFALGLMAKPMLVTAPFLMLLLDWWPLRRMKRLDRRTITPLIIEKVPLFIMVALSSAVTLAAQRSAMASIVTVPLLARAANASIAYAGYLGKTILPAGLAIVYPYRRVISPSLAVGATMLLLAITVAVLIYGRRRRYLVTGWFWFIGSLVPVIGIVQVGEQAMADRYTYVPLIGIFLVAVWLAADLFPSLGARPWLAAAGALLIAGCAVASAMEARYFRDSVTLFAHAADSTDPNFLAHRYLATAWLDRHDYDRAAAELSIALAMNPNDPHAHNALGLVLQSQGRADAARGEFTTAIRLMPQNVEAHQNLGALELLRGDRAAATRELQTALSIRQSPKLEGDLRVAEGKPAEAIAFYERAAAEDPDSAEVENDLGAALARMGRDDEAIRHYQSALRLEPGLYDALMNLGAILTRHERDAAALEHFSRAAALRTGSPEPLIYTALIDAKQRRIRDAIGNVTKAMAIDHDGSNTLLTNALHLKPSLSNIDSYLRFLQSQPH